MHSVNFVTCHDGFTLYDLVAYDRKHNEANGQGNHDGAGDNRSWNCGWEGDDGVPDEVLALRRRQLRNAWCLLAMSPRRADGRRWATSSAAPRAATTTPTTRTTRRRGSTGSGRAEFADLERFVGALLALRAPPPGARPAGRGGATRCSSFGAVGPADTRSRARARWRGRVGDLYVIANAWWEPLDVRDPGAGPVARASSTRRCAPPDDIVDAADAVRRRPAYDVAARSVVILDRR